MTHHTTPTDVTTDGILAFLETLDTDHSWGWPPIDVRRLYFVALTDPDQLDPSEKLARLWRAVCDDTLARYTSPSSVSFGEVDWDESLRRIENEMRGPITECDCYASRPEGHGGEIVGTKVHGGPAKIDCPIYLAEKDRRRTCRHSHRFGTFVPGDTFGTLTACCGAAWSVDDGPYYCKCCYAEVNACYDRHAIYAMWESPDLRHFAERIARLV